MSTAYDSIEHRRVHEADPGKVRVRDVDGETDGTMRLRMPVSSTGEARDGDAFSSDRLRGFAEQLRETRIPLFLDHGRGGPGETRYGQLRKVGYWAEPAIEERDGASELLADAVLVDPDILDDEVGKIRGALAWLRAQADAGLPIASSVGWSESTGDRDLPGDVDLLEISIVGIPSDPRTTTSRRAEYDVGDETVTIDPPEAVVNAATVALAKDDELDTDCGTGVGTRRAQQIAGDDVGPDVIDEVAAYLTSHEEDVTAAGTPTDWSNEEWSDCGNLQYAKWGGTGTGTGLDWAQDRANAVAEARDEELPYPDRAARNLDDPAFEVGDAVTYRWQGERYHGRVGGEPQASVQPPGMPDPVTGDEGEAIYPIHQWDPDEGAYIAIDGEPNTAKPESALDTSTEDLPPLADADIVDVDMDTNNLDDPEFSEGDAVSWPSQGDTVHGRVADIGEQFTPAPDVTITGDDGEAVYLIHQYDEELSPPQFKRENVAKPQSSLSESQMDMPPASDDNFADSENSMSEHTDTADDTGGMAEHREMMEEMMERMVDMQEQQMEMMEEMVDREGPKDDDEEEDEDEDGEMEADAGGADERTVTVNGTEQSPDEAIAQLRDEFDDLDADAVEARTQDRAEDNGNGSDNSTGGFGLSEVTH